MNIHLNQRFLLPGILILLYVLMDNTQELKKQSDLKTQSRKYEFIIFVDYIFIISIFVPHKHK